MEERKEVTLEEALKDILERADRIENKINEVNKKADELKEVSVITGTANIIGLLSVCDAILEQDEEGLVDYSEKLVDNLKSVDIVLNETLVHNNFLIKEINREKEKELAKMGVEKEEIRNKDSGIEKAIREIRQGKRKGAFGDGFVSLELTQEEFEDFLKAHKTLTK